MFSLKKSFYTKLLALIAIYSLAFTFLLFSIKMLRLESQAASSTTQLISATTRLTAGNQPPGEESVLYNTMSGSNKSTSNKELQQNIASQIIRLHVIANSDRQSDQNLKLKVRDSVIQDMQSALKDASSIEEARDILMEKMPLIQKKAQKTIQTEGYDYPVSISLSKRYFPVKVYGDLTFPAGEYEALCLEIGEASGRNWWCVLFPSLCFVDETYAVVPEKSKEKLQDSLSEEEYASLENRRDSEENTTSEKENTECEKKESKVQLRSGFLDWIINK